MRSICTCCGGTGGTSSTPTFPVRPHRIAPAELERIKLTVGVNFNRHRLQPVVAR